MVNSLRNRRSANESTKYERFGVIDGDHDFKRAVPGGYVEYAARRLRHGRVAYFNFGLAREMGLIDTDHESRMNRALESRILDTFALQIINEHDILHGTKIPRQDVLPGRYMATRYLQLQHPCKRGTTSGDGRSVWNGQVTHKRTTWDVTSCGTGATRLSPAAAILGATPMTGEENVNYGCGKAAVDEGITAAIQSEIFHRNGIATERMLAIIEFPDGYAINVRAGKCLLRPSHFFHHLKQGNRESLKGAVDYFIQRQVKNRAWPELSSAKEPYLALASQVALEFARMAARFESEYIFVWMDWDGDNILANGGIIDYGSVRQFGLYHRDYRFDDGDDRWSTTIPEQKAKARQTVQAFIQIADFIASGRKRNLRRFRKHAILSAFDREFDREIQRQFLRKIGFKEEHQRYLLQTKPSLVKRCRVPFSTFERASRARSYRVPDGITRDALFCMRDLLRLLPSRVLKAETDAVSALPIKEFLATICSNYSRLKDRVPTPWKVLKSRAFLASYEGLIRAVQSKYGIERKALLQDMSDRASYLNSKERVTGTSIIVLTEKILKSRARGLPLGDIQELIDRLIRCNVYEPSAPILRGEHLSAPARGPVERLMRSSLRIVNENSESL